MGCPCLGRGSFRDYGHSRGAVLVFVLVFATKSVDIVPDQPMTSNFTDEQLFAQVAALDGVVSADLSYRNIFGSDNVYVGRIIVTEEDRALPLLDHTYAILRQGHRNAGFFVDVLVKPTGAIFDAYDLLGSNPPARIEDRYGPQPGNGMPPADLPKLRR